jgi:hypothetical protein
MNKYMGTRLGYGSALLFSLLWLGPVQVIAETKWYQVEVVVFENTTVDFGLDDPVDHSVSDWPEMEGAIELMPDIAGTGSVAESTELQAADATAAMSYQALPETQLKLAGIRERLEASPDYRPVLITGWRQSIEGETSPVHITAGDLSSVDGIVQLRQLDSLQVVVDLAFSDENSITTGRIKDRRQVRLRKLYYFDNPVFGAMVQVSPL